MLNNFKMKNKLIIFSAAMIAFILIVGATGYFYNSKACSDMSSMFNDRLKPIVNLENSKMCAKSVESDMLLLLANLDTLSDSQRSKMLDNISAYSEKLSSEISQYEKSRLDEFEVQTLGRFKSLREDYSPTHKKILELAKAGNRDEALSLFMSTKGQLDEYQDYLDKLADYNVEAANAVNRQNDLDSASVTRNIIAAIALALLCATALTYFITTSITKPLSAANSQLKTIANGDLTGCIPEKYTCFKDEIGQISNSIMQMQASLKSLISSVKHSADTISGSSQTLLTITRESSEAIGCVAQAVEEVAAASMDQAKNSEVITGMAHALGDKIFETDNLASSMLELSHRTSELSQNGIEIIDNLDSNMAENIKISKEVNTEVHDMYNHLRNIEQTVILINKIANQTNLLALNASIEAARAGEMGLGFAIVAEEIRKLSEETEKAAKDINEMVNTIEGKAQSVVITMGDVESIVRQQGDAVSKTKDVFNNTSKLIGMVSSSVEKVKEHTKDVNQSKENIVISIDQISSLIQETTASTEETSASMEEQAAAIVEIENNTEMLSSISQKLHSDINKFKI
ncbi:methyl-accepting chemotaxis protein McpC (plasmid) [Peptoclostridium acidaminophilum DSM 3953]|uniref:Methyl-accepting chemotaxis protein McpC n=2 Tax=Peptoclostridium acidaminophilum TaxID=1731 RepID=W8TMX8_PEPAC|nr:methyl-accepting chemotaxis protein McpC [Peptoclostridium acidaminophilum DSM 3953]